MASDGDSSSTWEDDPAWEYNNLEDDDSITCLFCNKATRGGIDVARQHQIGACSLCPKDVKRNLKALMEKQKQKQKQKLKKRVQAGFGENEEGNDDVVKIPKLEKKRSGVHIGGQEKRTKLNVKDPHDLLMTRSNGEATSLRQSNMNDACKEEARARVVQAIATFFYEAGIPFSVARLDSFKEMIEAIANLGPNFVPPSCHELKGPFLKDEVDNINQWIKGHKEEWSKYGCSVMLDGWTDTEQRTSINLLVNSSKGTVFMESVDASSYTKFTLLERFVDRIGQANIVQVITDSSSDFVQAGKMLRVVRPNLFWTPCAAHCIDLMLEDIGNIAKVKKTIKKGVFLVGYIYNCRGILNMMREFTNNKWLTRTGITRLATTYLSLQRLHKQKKCLQNMFTSEKWTKSVWANEAKGKTAEKVVSMPAFWKNVVWTLKVMTPLIRALRLVKNEKKPAMGYIYKAMDTAKEAIRSALDKESDYKAVFDIIDKRWDCQLHHPLHAAGYYLNPEFYCTDPKIEKDSAVMKGLITCVQKLFPSHDKQDLIMKELIKWVGQAGHLRNDLAVRARGKIAPADWWKLYGKEIPNVQELAVKVLSLACSSSSCERNWSLSEQINFKKMNQLEHVKLKDLVFVRYNLRLKNRHTKDVYDPICLDDIDYSNEWLIGKTEEDQALEDELARMDAANAGLEDEEEEEVEEEYPYLNDTDNDFLVDWYGNVDEWIKDDDADDDDGVGDDDYDDDDE